MPLSVVLFLKGESNMFYYYDPTMILVLIGALLSMWASSRVQSTFNKYSRVRSMTGMTGAEAARRLLNSQGIYDVTVRSVPGQLTDHYVGFSIRFQFRSVYRRSGP